MIVTSGHPVYTAFMEAKDKIKWCRNRFINYRALTRAVAVRRQLVRYLQRYGCRECQCIRVVAGWR